MPKSFSTRSGLLALLVLVSPVLVAAPGCSEGGEPSQAAAQAPPRDPHALVAAGATLLDVRTPEEFSERHLEGAVNIPVDQVEARLAEIPRDRPVVVYCRSGARSMSAARILRRGGYDVEDLGSINEW
jgi:phage shock protein E